MDPIAVLAPVAEVILLEDRAHVTRSGQASLPAGRSTLEIAQVAPVLLDKTATATLGAAGMAGGAVHALRIVRRRVVLEAEQPALVRSLTEELRRLQRQAEQLAEEERLATAEIESIRTVWANTVDEIGEDASWSRAPAADWSADLGRIAERERTVSLRGLDAANALQELQRRIADLVQRIARAAAQQGPIQATLVCEVEVPAAGDYQLRVAYIVPCACWRPYHTARLLEDQGLQLEFSCAACIWQNTGEDWTGVALRCSTERASLGTAPPLLASDVLELRPRREALAVQFRQQAVHDTGGAAGAPASEVLGIDDGGETRLLACQGPATIPSDGLPHRVPLFAFTTRSEASLEVVGELAQAAILRTRQANASELPLLAGPVDLVRRGGLAGRTSILYIAPGSSFDLGWGPDGGIRAHRAVTEEDLKTHLLSGWITARIQVDLHLSNLSAEARMLTVSERIPVSSLEQVQIEFNAAETVPTAAPDENGFVRWSIVLPPRGHAQIRLRYQIRQHPKVSFS